MSSTSTPIPWKTLAIRLVNAMDDEDEDLLLGLALAVREAEKKGRRPRNPTPRPKRPPNRPLVRAIPGPGRRPPGAKKCVSCGAKPTKGSYCLSCYSRGQACNGFCGCGAALYQGGMCPGRHLPGGGHEPPRVRRRR